jgi:hypothetical protein
VTPDPCRDAERVLEFLLAHPGSTVSGVALGTGIYVRRVACAMATITNLRSSECGKYFYIKGWWKAKTGETGAIENGDRSLPMKARPVDPGPS